MKNDYEVRGYVTTIRINSPKYGIRETLIDTENLEKVKKATSWYVIWSEITKSFYVMGCMRINNKKKLVRLHRYIVDVTARKQLIDHIHHNTLDNRKSYLRVVTSLENVQNRRKFTSNSSGATGVSFMKKTNKWQAYIAFNGGQKHLGYFDFFAEALSARKQAENEYHLYKQSISI